MIRIDDENLQKHLADFYRDLPPSLGKILSLAFDIIGSRVQASYYRMMGGAPIPEKLTARSTRHIRSFSPQGGARPGGVGRSEQIRNITVSGNTITGEFGSSVEYAHIHEFGGVIKPKNGKYLHFKTFDGSWHSVEKVTMPARPHLRPAARDEQDRIKQMVAQKIADRWNEIGNNV
jgi:phage gpG-like protein